MSDHVVHKGSCFCGAVEVTAASGASAAAATS